jgi:hypothetical protein
MPDLHRVIQGTVVPAWLTSQNLWASRSGDAILNTL